ncbi:MAG: hypothetical protein ACRD3W_28670, partial [Terriglobales bacterium]
PSILHMEPQARTTEGIVSSEKVSRLEEAGKSVDRRQRRNVLPAGCIAILGPRHRADAGHAVQPVF